MESDTDEDHKKFTYALAARDIRRVAAKIHHANIDDQTLEIIDTALDQLETRLWVMSFHDPKTGDLIQNQDVYSDGRPVTTTITRGEGFTTVVHSPDPDSETGAEELASERWPAEADEPPCVPPESDRGNEVE